MNDIIYSDKINQFQGKSHKLSFSLFLLTIILASLLIIGYICSNITLMKLGYQSIDLEQKKEQLLAKKYQLEYSVECLSSLTRIERIANQELGMSRPEKIEFIVMLPNNIEKEKIINPPSQENDTRYLRAGNFLPELVNLKIFENQ